MATQREDGSICYSNPEFYQRMTNEMLAFTEWMEKQGYRYCRKADAGYEYYPLAKEDFYDYFGFDPVAARREWRQSTAGTAREGDDDGK